jgi:DNA-directed RNA polymerase subunit H (RpoH/RPB5)
MTSAVYLHGLKCQTIQMMDRRGYNVDAEKAVLNYTPAFFEQVFGEWFIKNPDALRAKLIESKHTSIRSMMSTIYTHSTIEGERALIMFLETGSSIHSISNKETGFFAELMLLFNCNTGILISSLPLSSNADASLTEIRSPDTGGKAPQRGEYFIQKFHDSELEIDPTHFCLGEEYSIMTPAEVQALFNETKTKFAQYPKQDMNRPVVKYLGGREGQLVKISRSAIIPGTLLKHSIFYRYIHNPPKKK